MTKKLHHMAFRCRDSEETRAFYEEIIGLPLVATLPIEETKTGRRTRVLHTFFAMEDGSHLAFFEAPDQPFEFKAQHDFDLHVAMEASQEAVDKALAAAKARGLEIRGPSDHGFIKSYYFRDPNGYVVELTQKTDSAPEYEKTARTEARAILDRWKAEA